MNAPLVVWISYGRPLRYEMCRGVASRMLHPITGRPTGLVGFMFFPLR